MVDMEAQKCVDISQCPVDCSVSPSLKVTILYLILQKVDCPELDCVNDPVTPPGSCCPVCGRCLYIYIHLVVKKSQLHV